MGPKALGAPGSEAGGGSSQHKGRAAPRSQDRCWSCPTRIPSSEGGCLQGRASLPQRRSGTEAALTMKGGLSEHTSLSLALGNIETFFALPPVSRRDQHILYWPPSSPAPCPCSPTSISFHHSNLVSGEIPNSEPLYPKKGPGMSSTPGPAVASALGRHQLSRAQPSCAHC